jgi:hypothetical protein
MNDSENNDVDLLGKTVRWTNTLGLEQIGTLVGIVTEPSYIFAKPWMDGDLVVCQSRVKNLRAAS